MGQYSWKGGAQIETTHMHMNALKLLRFLKVSISFEF
jgi:hypothetical protein